MDALDIVLIIIIGVGILYILYATIDSIIFDITLRNYYKKKDNTPYKDHSDVEVRSISKEEFEEERFKVGEDENLLYKVEESMVHLKANITFIGEYDIDDILECDFKKTLGIAFLYYELYRIRGLSTVAKKDLHKVAEEDLKYGYNYIELRTTTSKGKVSREYYLLNKIKDKKEK